MDRFSQGRPDPQDVINYPITHCACGCKAAIYGDDDEFYELDKLLFAEKDCILRYVGARRGTSR